MTLAKRFYIGAAIVLFVGLCSSVLIYLTAADDSDVDGAYQVVVIDGKAYPIAGSQSKAYVRQLQRFGGKASVLFDELGTWFAGLWRGKALAITVGWITLFVSVALLLFGRWLSLTEKEKADSSSLRSSE
jgi:hypothetical protein